MIKGITVFNKLTNHPDAGKLLLRLTFGILVMFHGIAKILHGTQWISTILETKGIPGFIAYGVFAGEIIAPIFIILGLMTRPAALIYAFNILIATLLVGIDRVFTVTKVGAWGLETEALFFFGAISIMLIGSGKYSMTTDS